MLVEIHSLAECGANLLNVIIYEFNKTVTEVVAV